jgi:hypothetical protein
MHVELMLLCSSDSDAATLRQVLTAFSVTQKVSTSTGLVQEQFKNASISSFGALVAIAMDLVDRMPSFQTSL